MVELKCIVLYSGGKDSNLALWYAAHQGWSVELLLSVIPRSSESYMFHYPNVEWTKLQAEALGYPIRMFTIEDVGEDEVQGLGEALREIRDDVVFDSVVSGAVMSDYQRSRIDRVCEEIGVYSIAPLWGKDPFTLLRIEIEMGFKFLVTACTAQGLDQGWLGRLFTISDLNGILEAYKKFGVNPIFEGGEAESFVVDSPLFRYPIRILDSEKIWYGDRGYLMIRDAVLDSRGLPDEAGYR
ncbi:MAG: diphthine--ammonia ligase [Candidatus Bathyarchaeia archaeon]